MIHFISGALVMAYLTVALFFARFRTRTGDPLFGAFALAFVLLAAQRVLLAISTDENLLWTYVIRLAAFVVILLAIIGKNIFPRRAAR